MSMGLVGVVVVTLGTAIPFLHIDGHTRDDYMLPLIGREGNYHCPEISLFCDLLCRNIALRASKATGINSIK